MGGLDGLDFASFCKVTKLVRANKFMLDTVMFKVGEDAISEAFSRAADAADNAQAGLLFLLIVLWHFCC